MTTGLGWAQKALQGASQACAQKQSWGWIFKPITGIGPVPAPCSKAACSGGKKKFFSKKPTFLSCVPDSGLAAGAGLGLSEGSFPLREPCCPEGNLGSSPGKCRSHHLCQETGLDSMMVSGPGPGPRPCLVHLGRPSTHRESREGIFIGSLHFYSFPPPSPFLAPLPVLQEDSAGAHCQPKNSAFC